MYTGSLLHKIERRDYFVIWHANRDSFYKHSSHFVGISTILGYKDDSEYDNDYDDDYDVENDDYHYRLITKNLMCRKYIGITTENVH